MSVIRACGNLVLRNQPLGSLPGGLLNKGLIDRANLLVRHESSLRNVRVSVGDRTIHVVRRGHGPQPLLLMPGALGTAVTDLLPQLEGLDPSVFSLVGWDPPGYGDSRPPDRDFTDFFKRDAQVALTLMSRLGYSRFSMLGWSDGGITALCAAIACPSAVDKMVVLAANAYISQSDIDMIHKVEDVSKWSDRMRAPMEAVYGVQGFPILWTGWCNAFKEYFNRGGDICSEEVHKISCPTLVVQGAKDPMVAMEHVGFLHETIPFAEKFVFEDGKHNLHFKYKDKFNALVTEFLTK